MAAEDDPMDPHVEALLDTPDLAGALESERFKHFLDHLPIATAVAELQPAERIIYVNLEFERLTGRPAAAIEGKAWDFVPGEAAAAGDDRALCEAIVGEQDYMGVFSIERDGGPVLVDAWSNIIEDDSGAAAFRLIALADTANRAHADRRELEQRIRDKDTLLRELQHRVRNNLQMITALIRLEARNMPPDASDERLDRLAGRIQALALLYQAMTVEELGDSVDLGVYLGQIASAVMSAHAVEGIRLDLKVDSWPVSINVAMPAGLVVNELMTNALKHAFKGRDVGVITLHGLVDEYGCRVVVADDGVGLAPGVVWPAPGKLGAMIVQSLRDNARAGMEVVSEPGRGLRVTILFARADAELPHA